MKNTIQLFLSIFLVVCLFACDKNVDNIYMKPIFNCEELELNIGDDCILENAEIGIVDETCTCILPSPGFDCPDLGLNIGDNCMIINELGIVSSNCECDINTPFDCPELQSNIGDNCILENGNTGTLTENCECA